MVVHLLRKKNSTHYALALVLALAQARWVPGFTGG